MDNNVILDAKPIGEIKGSFNIPAYQRGYRWGDLQVKTLLNDLYVKAVEATTRDYCLQPVVVLKKGECQYDLIDGQQRLTTIYILLSYIRQFFPFVQLNFSLEYETRKHTRQFLDQMDESLAQTNIDFFHIFNAHNAIKEWLEDTCPGETNKQSIALFTLNQYIDSHVKVIWYEVGNDTDPIALFTRLNIGKIQLTNAELIRALFLTSSEEDDAKRKQQEMSIQWDNIEKQLCADDNEFWSFITRKSPKAYPTRIELLFDLMFGKSDSERDTYFTFFKMEERIRTSDKEGIWQEVINSYLQIKEWYIDNEYYHKIGYLIASGHKTMTDIFKESQGKRKSEFKHILDKLIAESITWKTKNRDDYWELEYTNAKDYDRISRILLLFNVQSILKSKAWQRFPFSKYNTAEWSLEHIHAQNSEGLKTVSIQLEWLSRHLSSLKDIHKDETGNELIGTIEEIIRTGKLGRNDFDDIFRQVVNELSENTGSEYIHTLSNMALLTSQDNASLNNSTFDVKRNMIVEMDRQGAFIPYCTKMVFLKYYTKSSDNQVHFWGKADRDAYLNAIKNMLQPYYELIDFEA